jgi:hypothetical protein
MPHRWYISFSEINIYPVQIRQRFDNKDNNYSPQSIELLLLGYIWII